MPTNKSLYSYFCLLAKGTDAKHCFPQRFVYVLIFGRTCFPYKSLRARVVSDNGIGCTGQIYQIH